MKEKFIHWCEKNNILITESKPINYGHQFKLSKGADKLSLSIYQTGKQLAQGKDSELKTSVESFFGITGVKSKTDKSSSIELKHDKSIWIGVDESGKGDFFGPLVVSAVVVQKDLEDQLLSLGVKDSKKLNDHRVREMAPQLMNKLKHHSIVLMPEDYNDRYDRLKNLNHLLADMHCACYQALYDKNVELMISDQFASDKKLLENRLDKANLPSKDLIQAPRAEEDMAVACASILARFHFIEGIKSLSHNYGTDFPKGAGESVDFVAKDFAEAFGLSRLRLVAKTHFKTFDRLVQNGSEE